jgi:predicted RNA-binding protein (virulence factor B family)
MELGEINILKVLRFTAPGAYLGDEEGNDVLLPGKYIPQGLEEGDDITVFLYKDSEDRLVATTETPKVMLHGFAYLKVEAVNLYGAFLNWGLEKDLMVPFKEQNQKMEEGKSYLVTLQMDHATDRLFASMKVNRYLKPCEDQSLTGKEVEVLICDKTDLGLKVIVDDLYHGIIYRNDINQPLRRGDRIRAFILLVREDGKLDIRLEKIGNVRFDEAETTLLEILKNKGQLRLTDKSDPDEIRETVGMSKKLFKQTIGKLYKAQLITLQPDSIQLVDNPKTN